jgi:hypothetical protein
VNNNLKMILENTRLKYNEITLQEGSFNDPSTYRKQRLINECTSNLKPVLQDIISEHTDILNSRISEMLSESIRIKVLEEFLGFSFGSKKEDAEAPVSTQYANLGKYTVTKEEKPWMTTEEKRQAMRDIAMTASGAGIGIAGMGLANYYSDASKQQREHDYAKGVGDVYMQSHDYVSRNPNVDLEEIKKNIERNASRQDVDLNQEDKLELLNTVSAAQKVAKDKYNTEYENKGFIDKTIEYIKPTEKHYGDVDYGTTI